MERLLPGLLEEVTARGGTRIDMGASTNWFHFGSWKKRVHGGITVGMQSRELLEHVIRERVSALPNVTFLQADVASAKLQGAKPELRLGSGEALSTDWLVDASGRATRLPQWLIESHFRAPRKEIVGIAVTYVSARFKPQKDRDWRGILIYPEPPEKRGGGIFQMEDGTALATMIGWCDEQPPVDDESFLEYARQFPQPDVYDLLKHSERCSEFRRYQYKNSIWHRYDRMERFPSGVCAVGDALCCFDPVFGQGMMAAALTAELLAECAKSNTSLATFSEQFRKRCPEVLKVPWMMARNEDYRYREVRGRPPFGVGLMHWYTAHVHWLTGTDDDVYRTFAKVMHGLAKPDILFHPKVLGKVLASAMFGPKRITERPRGEST